MNYYNDNSPSSIQWLHGLISDRLIPRGIVDGRSIARISGNDLPRFRQCHFFAGIGGWPYALELAGWPAHREVWTGSCPCQPFSCAGQGLGEKDPRHLWPEFLRLISECRPATIFGEQVASKAGRQWLAGIRADLETLGYAFGAADLCAACVGAPHTRQRLFWVADSSVLRLRDRQRSPSQAGAGWRSIEDRQLPNRPQGSSDVRRLADAVRSGRAERRPESRNGSASVRGSNGRLADAPKPGSFPGALGGLHSGEEGDGPRNGEPERCDAARGLEHSAESRSQRLNGHGGGGHESRLLETAQARSASASGELNPWVPFDLIPCADGKTRRTQPGIRPLAHGVSNRMVKLSGLGNAIVPQVAAAFIAAFLESESVPSVKSVVNS